LPTNWDARHLSIDASPTYEPTVGRWLWQLEDTRHETKQALKDITPASIDWKGSPDGNSIGTLLYHIALIELDWLSVEVLENAPLPQEFQDLFPLPARDERGHLSPLYGVSLEEHLQRLDRVREELLGSFHAMDVKEFRRLRTLPDYEVTPEWVLYHLVQHETEHRGHIQIIRGLAEQALPAL
jgi:uncharacterized damage-inducible protein DinB